MTAPHYSPSAREPAPPPSKRRRWMFRVAAVLMGLLPFLILEASLRLIDVGRPTEHLDPFVGFSKLHPLFELSEDGDVYETTQSRLLFFERQEFAAKKPENGYRIFCLGGSTVRGRPYTTDSAFSKWMQLQLADCDPATKYECINCGGLSYASYRLTHMVEETLRYEPDLVVVATGHNEFLEDRTFEAVKDKSAGRKWVEEKLYSSHTVTAARKLWSSWRDDDRPHGRTELADRLATRLDDSSGYASYHRDDEWRANVATHFELSLRTMIRLCREKNVPVVLVRLGSNVRDCPPFKSEHKPGLSAGDEQNWQMHFDDATAADGDGDLRRALAAYRAAESIDDEHALLNYRLARVYDRMGEYDSAGRYFLRAKDLDVCPLRMLESMSDAVAKIAEETETPLVDARTMLDEQSPQGVPGANHYMDHVHPTMNAHQQIARQIVETLHEDGRLPESFQPWTDRRRRRAYREHFDRLGARHFAVAREQITWLEGWARRRRLAEELAPVDARGRLHEGHRRLNLGEPLVAWGLYRKAMKERPEMKRNLLRHALELFDEGRAGDARDLLLKLRPEVDGELQIRVDLARLVVAVELEDVATARVLLQDSGRRFGAAVNDSEWKAVMPDVLERAKALASAGGTDGGKQKRNRR